MASASSAAAGPSASSNIKRLPPIDLRPYGLNLVLDESLSQEEFEARLTKDIVLNKVNADDKGFTFANGAKELKYSNPRNLGKGYYGAVTECTNSNLCRQVAIKNVELNKKFSTPEVQLANFLKECIIQIILIEVSKPVGRVPEVYRIGISDEETPTSGFIISELMDDTLDKFIKNKSEEEKDVIVTDALVQVADILDFFQKTVRFNHRDLKSNNVMYKTVGGKPVYRIIDFGFACIMWNQLEIQTNTYQFQTCFKAGRDLAQLTYELKTYGRLSSRLELWLLLLNKVPSMEYKTSYRYFNIPESRYSPDAKLIPTRPQELSNAVKQLPYYRPSDVPNPSAAAAAFPVAAAAPAARVRQGSNSLGSYAVTPSSSIGPFGPLELELALRSPVKPTGAQRVNVQRPVAAVRRQVTPAPPAFANLFPQFAIGAKAAAVVKNEDENQVGLPGIFGGYKRKRTGNRRHRKTRKQSKKRRGTRKLYSR
uniref:Protein kinase domain-containing protein n=1 Tax=viral metagenome TaxID=1070528 RepID=A0A6C0KA51_9ZZZZ